MNIYVCIKQVPDTEATILVKDGKSINETNVKWIISPYDEYAVEEALKLKEKIPGSKVTAVCLGPDRVQNALRTALAMGADVAVHVECAAVLDSAQHGQGPGPRRSVPTMISAWYSSAGRPSTTTPASCISCLAEDAVHPGGDQCAGLRL